jgi:hypothetical protein
LIASSKSKWNRRQEHHESDRYDECFHFSYILS